MSANVDQQTAPASAAGSSTDQPAIYPPPQLRIHDRQVFVGFGATQISQGLALADLALVVPDVTFPFDIAGSAATRYQRRPCQFGYLDVRVDQALIRQAVQRVWRACSDHLAELRLRLKSEILEGEGLLHAPQGPVPFTFRLGLQAEENLALVYIYDLRVYGPAPLPTPWLAALMARAATRAPAVPQAIIFGAAGFAFDPVPWLLRKTVPLRGFRLPQAKNSRLKRVTWEPDAIHLHFASNLSGELPFDEQLLTCLEGARLFAQGEALLAQGNLAEAEAFYLRHGEAPDAHPFAQERLLGLLVARSNAHDLALDVADKMVRSRPASAMAWWAQASIHHARGDQHAAGNLFLKLGQLARQQGEEWSAFHAFAAAGRALLPVSPGLAGRAFQNALALRPDDLDCLSALAEATDLASDAEGALHAYRRVSALAREPQQAARAHVRLGHLVDRITHDRASARLHFDAALQIAPDYPEALLGLAILCREDGEHLRAIKLFNQLAIVAQNSHQVPLQSRAVQEAGATWDQGLGHPANALARYQEAAQLTPDDCQPHLRMALLHDRLDHPAESLAAYEQVIQLARTRSGTEQENEIRRLAAFDAHHALARLATERLVDPVRARRHFEAALALKPNDPSTLGAMLPWWREEKEHQAQLANGCEIYAASCSDPVERAALLAEAGELTATALKQPEKAESLLKKALLINPECSRALETMAFLAESRADGPALCRFLEKLLQNTADSPAKAVLWRRLARAAGQLAANLDLAADAWEHALALEPEHLPDLAQICAVHRQREDYGALAKSLGNWARALESDGQFVSAASAWRELAQLQVTKLGNQPEALTTLEHAAVLDPENHEVLEQLADVSLSMGRALVAREAYQSLLAALQGEQDRERVARLQSKLGQACQALGDRAGAAKAWATAFAVHPEDDELGQRLDGILKLAGLEHDRAQVFLARAKAKESAQQPSAAAAYFVSAAQIFARLGEAKLSHQAFTSALQAEPDGPAAKTALPALYQAALDAHDFSQASMLLARRAYFEDDAIAAARMLFEAACLVKDSAPDRFLTLIAAAIERDNACPVARAALAELRMAEGEYDQALAHAKIALGAKRSAAELPDRAKLQRLAAKAASELGDDLCARTYLYAYICLKPHDTPALMELAALHRRTGASDDLASILKLAVQHLKGSEAISTWRELVELWRQKPEHRDESISALRGILKLDANDAFALENLAQALDRPDEASERMEILSRLMERPQPPAWIDQQLIDCGEKLLSSGKPAEAMTAFAKASSDAQAAEHLFSCGLRLVEFKQTSAAIDALSRVVAIAENSSTARDALQMLVDLHEANGDREQATWALNKLAGQVKGSERASTYLRCFEHLMAMGRLIEAKETLTMALEASPGDRRALVLMKALCIQLNDDLGHAATLQALLALPKPDRKEAAGLFTELGEVLLRLNEWSLAEEALRKALINDRTRIDAARHLLDLLLEREAFAEAFFLGEQIGLRTADQAESAAFFMQLSHEAQWLASDSGLALRFARLAAERDPRNFAIQRRLGEVLYQCGSMSEALSVYRQLVAAGDWEDEENAGEDRLRLAELLLAAGDRDTSIELLRKELISEPTNASAAELLYQALRLTDPAQAMAALEEHCRALTPGARSLAIHLRLAQDARFCISAPKVALAHYDQALKLGADSLAVDLLRLPALRDAGDKQALLETLRRVAASFQKTNQDEKILAVLDEIATVSQELNEFSQSATAWEEGATQCLKANRAQEAAHRFRHQGYLLRDRLNEHAAARQAFRRAFRADPKDVASANAAADLCRQQGDWRGEAELVEAYAAQLSKSPARSAAFLRLARIKHQLHDFPGAIPALEQAAKASRSASERADLLLMAAGWAEEYGEALLARQLRSQASAADSEHLVAWRRCLPDFREHPINYARLLDALANVIRLSTDASEIDAARGERARIFELLGDRQLAAQAYLEIVRSGVRSLLFGEAAERAQCLFYTLGQYAPAVEASVVAARAASDHAQAAYQLVGAAQLLHEYAADSRQAELILREAATLAPSSPLAYAVLADLYRREGDIAGQVEALQEQAARVNEDRSRQANLYLQVGELCLHALKKPDQSVQACTRALQCDPHVENASRCLISALIKAGRQKSLDIYRELESTYPEASSASSSTTPSRAPSSPSSATFALLAVGLGKACEQEQWADSALTHYEEAIRYDAHHLEAWRGVLRNAQKTKDPTKALAACRRLLELTPKQPARQRASLYLVASRWCMSLGLADESLKHLEVAALHAVGGPATIRQLTERYLQRKMWAKAAAMFTWFAQLTSDSQARQEAWQQAAELYANRVDDFTHAAEVVERALQEQPHNRGLLERLCALRERGTQFQAFVDACGRLEQAFGGEPLDPFLLSLGRAHQQLAQHDQALARLRQALTREYSEDLAAEIYALAQQLGNLDALAAVEMERIARLPASEADQVASRYRQLADRLEIADPLRAADLLGRAFALVAREEDLVRQADLLERGADLKAALNPLLILTRRNPLVDQNRGRLAMAVRAAGDSERVRVLESVELFFDSDCVLPAASLWDVRITDALRGHLYSPMATGPIAAFLRAIGPALGTVFPGDLTPYQVDENDRVGPLYAAALASRLKAAQRAVGISLLDAYLSRAAGMMVQLEPGNPDRLVIGLGALTGFEPGVLSFLLVRACELSRCGYALASQAGAGGLDGLLRCALAACGISIEVPAEFAEHLPPLTNCLAALPNRPELEQLAHAAHPALSALDAQGLLAELERSASRVALIASGDPAAAMRSVVRLSPSWQSADLATIDLRSAAEQSAQINDILLTCLRDDWRELRAACRMRNQGQ